MIPTVTSSSHPHLRALAFSREEYRARLRRVQKAMAPLDLDALLCHMAPNVCYLTGFEGVLWFKYALAIVPREGDPILLAEDFEMPNACATVWCDDWVTYSVFNGDPIAVTRDLLEKRGLSRKRLGFELGQWALPVTMYHQFRDSLPSATLVDASHIVESVKAIKSPAEIEVMRRCAKVTSDGMIASLKAVREGATDNDVAAVAYDVLMRGGSEYMSLDPIITVGARASIPHSTHARVKIGRGDSALLEMGACFHRYSTATMRTAAVSPVPDIVRDMTNACTTAVNTVISHMRPGAVGREIAKKADAVWPEFISRYIWHGNYAYSLGIGFPPDWNDSPCIVHVDHDLVLQPGMVFHVTTSLREVGVCGTASSETVLVTEKGAEVLTQIPHGLTVA